MLCVLLYVSHTTYYTQQMHGPLVYLTAYSIILNNLLYYTEQLTLLNLTTYSSILNNLLQTANARTSIILNNLLYYTEQLTLLYSTTYSIILNNLLYYTEQLALLYLTTYYKQQVHGPCDPRSSRS